MISRKLSFWILLCSISAAGVAFAVRYFREAFPIVTLNLKMDRSAALNAAKGLAARRAWGPPGYSLAASLDLGMFDSLKGAKRLVTSLYSSLHLRKFHKPEDRIALKANLYYSPDIQQLSVFSAET